MIPKEHTTATDRAKNLKTSSSSGKTWSRLNDPRIVRVSRAFGGKDRHSKVCTVRGLRDRRVRLSVPTAVQLYDLQERLGLNQPSKVIDWLLNAAKSDIDELPPLQIPPGSFSHHNLQRMHKTNYCDEKQPVLRISGNINWINDPFKNPASCRSNFVWGLSNKDASREKTFDKNENPARIDDQEDRSHEFSVGSTQGTTYVNSPNNFFPRPNRPSLLYNSFLKWDPSSDLTLYNPPRNFSAALSSSQPEDFQSFNLLQFPSTLSVYQPEMSTQLQSYFPSQNSTTNAHEFFLKHQNFQSSQLSNPSVIPVITANLLQSQSYSSKSVRNKENEFHLE